MLSSVMISGKVGAGRSPAPHLHAHAAGGAARTSAAHRRVRDAVQAADLEQGRPARRVDDGAADVADRHARPRAHRQPAPGDHGQHRHQHAGEGPSDGATIAGEHLVLRSIRPVGELLDVRQPLRVLDQQRHRPARHHEPAERGKRHRDGEEQQHRLDGAIAGREPQPVVQPHAAVHPDHQQQRALQQRAVGPQASQFVEIAILDAERNAGDARVDDVGEQQEGDQQAEAELGQLPGRQTQRRASRQLVEGETDMGNQRRHQQERAGHRARHHPAPAAAWRAWHRHGSARAHD